MMKNTVFILITFICILVLPENLQAQTSVSFKKNKYKLTIISNINAYNQTILEDSNKRMVPLQCYVIPFLINWKYATKNNFTHEVLYHKPVALIRLPVAKALQKVEEELKQKGLGLIFYDCYRPYSVTEKMWSIIPDERYAANPTKGSGHNRGIAVDASIISLKDSIEIAMPTAFDNFTDSAHQDFMQLDSIILQHRMLLKTVMEKYGFTALPTEWWHYYLKGAADYELLDIDFHLFSNKNACF